MNVKIANVFQTVYAIAYCLLAPIVEFPTYAWNKVREIRSRKGSAALVTMLITLVILLIVGLVVVGNLKTVADTLDLGTTGNSTRTTLFTNTYSAFNLAVIIPIVAAAGAILGVVFLYFRRGA